MAAWWDDPRFAAPAPQPSSGLASLGSLAASPPSAEVSGSLGDLSAPTRMGIPRLGASPTRAQLDQYFASLPDVPKPAAPPSPEKSPESAGYVGLGDLWKDVKWAAGQVVPSFRAAQAQLQEGPDPYAQRDAGDDRIEQSRQATQQHLAELGSAANQTVIPLPFVNNITRGTLASLPQNLGFMGASLFPMESSAQLSGLAGAGAGAAAAAPLAAIPVIGPYLGGGGALAGAARGYFAGTGARAAYLMERDNAMRDYRALEDDKARAMGNPPLTDQEWSANYASHYLPYAEQRAKNMAAIGAVQNAVAMPLVAGGAQRAVGGKFLQGAAEVAGGQAVQMGGMAATHIAQTQQDVRAGAQAGPEPSLWSPADWGHALKTVAPDVVALTAVAGAMGAATGRLRAALGKSTPEAETSAPGNATPETAAPKKLDLESLRATMALARPEDLVNALQSLGSVDAPGSSLTPGATARLEQARQRLTTELQQRVTPETLAQPLTTPLGEAGYLGLANRSNQLSDATLQAMATRELPADAPESWRAAQLAYQQESKDRAALADFPQQSDLPAKQRNAIIQRLLATTEGTPREGEYASPDYNLASLSNDALQHYQRAGEALLQDGNRPLSEGMRDRLETAVDALHAESDQRSAGVPRNPQEIRDQDVTGRLLALPPRRFQELLPTLAPPVLDRLSADLAGRSSLSPALELRAEWIRRQQTGTPAEPAAPALSPQEALRNEVSQINQQPPAPGERANASNVTPSPTEITGPESRTEIPLSPSLENTHGETRQAETEALLRDQQQQPSTLRGITTQEIPLANLRLSEDVPQFKSDANPETGVVEPLGGKYERTGTAPIVVWERKNGQQEVISGRHRFDLARRSGEQTIPAQVLREADGFTAQKAAILDAELNIRDGQGKVKDYVNYFQYAGISPEEANLRGLVSRSIGQRAFTIANDGTESLLAAHRADVLSDDAAYRIAQSAPRDERLQAVGIKAIQSGKSIATATNLMQAVKSLGMTDSALDMFGFDESAMRQAEAMALIAERHQRQIGEQLAAVQGAAKRPEAARKLGVDVADPEAVRARIAEMKQARDQWDTWSTNPDLVAQIRQEVDAEAQAKANPPRASAATGASANSAEMARAISAHPDVQRLGDRIRVVERQTDLRPALQPKDGGPIKAVIDRGKIVLVGEHWTAQDLANLEGVLQHEGGVHLARDSGFYDPQVQAAGKVLRAVGLKSLAVKASWNDVIHQFQALAKRPNSSAQRAYELARSALGAEARANPGLLHEEALGYLAELNPKHSLVLRLAAMVKATLYRMGVKVPLDESALVALTRAGLRSVAKEPMASDHAADPRYSRRTSTSPQQDSEYLAAAERGDMDVAQRMVDEAARRAGYTVEGFHGKRGEWGFTVFNTTSEGGAHFGTLAQAEMRGGKGNARRFFLKADSPARLRDTGEFKRIPKGKSSAIYLNRYEGISAETVSKIPGSVLDRMSDAEFRRAVPEAGDSTLVRNAWQIKSADPITRDDSGNIIPLSQRFDKSTTDIRYSRPHAWADNLPPEVASMADKIGAQPKGLLDRLREMRGTLPTRLRAGMVDRFARLLENDRQRFGRDAIDTQTELSSWVAAKMSKSAEGAMEGVFLHGRLKWENGALNVQETHKGLAKVLEPVASAGELNRFWQWIIANRSERLLREGRERLFTPAEIAAGKQLDAGTMADGANRSTVYQQAFARYVALQKSVLNVAQQSGLFNAQQRAQWEHDFYLPFYRVIENEGEIRGPSTGGGKLVRQKAFEMLNGGTEKLGDPLQNILRNWHHLIDASLKNRAATLALDTARHLGIADVVPSTKTDKNSVWVMKDGQKTHYNVSDPLTLEAISSLNSPLMDGSAIRALSAVKRALTVGVTISPAFKIANLLRDSIAALATSRLDANVFKLKPLTNPIQGFLTSKEGGYSPGSLRAKLYSALGADTTGAAQAALMTGGGTFHFGTILEGDTNAAARRIAGWQPDTVLDSPAKLRGLFDAVKSGLDAWNRFGDRLETANRAALYTQLRQEGKTHLQAALAARDLMDFSQAGGWPAMRFLVNMVPFLNARVQGLDVLYRKGVQPMTRALRGAASDSEKQQALRFATTTFMVGLASSLLYLHYKDDHEFRSREQWDRDSYWWFKIGGKAYRIPKPFEVGALGTIAERLVEQLSDHEATGKLFADRMKAMLSQTFAFDPTPQLVKPLLDVYANRDSFTGRPIETLDMERLSPELRQRYNTSALAVGMSQAGLGKAGLSPIQIESLMRGYLGWIGAQSLMVGDLMARPALGLPTRPLKQSDIPLIGDLMQRFAPDGRGSRYVTEFYDQLKQIQQVAADAQLFTKLQDPKALQELVKGHGQELARAKPMEAVARELALLGQAERLIANDRNLSATEKQARIDDLSKKKAALAQQAMAALRMP